MTGKLLIAMLTVLVTGVLGPAVRAEDRPGNDDFAAATPIPGPGFRDVFVFNGATLEPGEPQPACHQAPASVWFRYDGPPGSYVAVVDRDYPLVIAVWRGPSLTELTAVSCGTSAAHVPAFGDGTYWIQVALHEEWNVGRLAFLNGFAALTSAGGAIVGADQAGAHAGAGTIAGGAGASTGVNTEYPSVDASACAGGLPVLVCGLAYQATDRGWTHVFVFSLAGFVHVDGLYYLGSPPQASVCSYGPVDACASAVLDGVEDSYLLVSTDDSSVFVDEDGLAVCREQTCLP